MKKYKITHLINADFEATVIVNEDEIDILKTTVTPGGENSLLHILGFTKNLKGDQIGGIKATSYSNKGGKIKRKTKKMQRQT